MILKSVSTVFSIFLMIGIGIFISHRKWLDRDTARVIPRLIINFSLPAQILVIFNEQFTRQKLMESVGEIAVLFAAMGVTYFTARLAAGLLGIRKTRRGVFSVLFAFSNSVFIGFPVALALFGDTGMPYAAFFYLANTTCFWTFGYVGIRRDAQHIHGAVGRIRMVDILRNVVSVPVMFIIISILLLLLDAQQYVPRIVIDTAKYVGGLTTPLSMIFVGNVLYDIGFRGLRMEKDVLFAVIGRFAVSAAVLYALCALCGIGGTQANVYLTQMTLPAMTQTVILSELCGADSDYAAKGIAWTTALSLFTIPAVMMLFGV